jgi:hypothetical protein
LPRANNASLSIPSGFILSEKYYSAVLFNGPNGKAYLTDAIKVELRDSPAAI